MSDVRKRTQIVGALTRGESILVTGAGFSRGAVDKNGDELPLGRDLAKQIWPIAFGDEPFDDSSTLGEVFRLANRKSGGLLRGHLELCFSVDGDRLPDRYVDWFQLPWHRIYTLNIDNLDEVVATKISRTRPIKALSASSSTPGDGISDRELPVIHLNGRLADFPNLTFDPPSYGSRTGHQDPWYQQFITDIVTRPTVYVGTVLEESPIWHYLSQRGYKGNANETRPKSWLVTRGLPVARRELLAEFNIDLVEMYEAEFYSEYLLPSLDTLRIAADAKANRVEQADSSYIIDVASVIASAPTGDANFLLGREPTWGDVHNGYAAEFEWDTALISELRSRSDGTVLIHGDPGCGKTTSLMRAAAVLAADGNTVLWISRETAKGPVQIRKEIIEREPDYIFIDEIDRFGESTPGFIEGLGSKLLTAVVVGGIRTRRLRFLEITDRLQSVTLFPAPPLSDSDAIQLINALDRGNRLGALLSLSALDRIDRITKRAGRQLLVSMIEATSGRQFHDKIASECRDLAGIDLAAYGVVCCAHAADNQFLTRDDVLLAIDASNNEGVRALASLVTGNQLVSATGRIKTRHRVIAESAVDYFREDGRLQTWTEHLLFLFAVKYEPADMKRGRYGRLLIRFLNHDFLKDLLGSSVSVQTVYGSLESVLSKEFHFWLQRGSFEIEVGDLDKAETFLLQARALRPDDIKLDTAWSYLQMKRALKSPSSSQSNSLAFEALSVLESVMQRAPDRSPHTYHVYLTQGIKWLQNAPLGPQEKRELRENLERHANVAQLLFKNSDKISEAATEVRRKLLLMPIF